MRKFFTFIPVFFLTVLVWAQVPGKMSYQAVVRDNSGALLTNYNIGMQISILQGSVDGIAVYVERQFPATNENGLVTIEIGGDNATVVSGIFSDIDWAGDSYFIKTETDLNGGSNYTLSGTSQLLSVPYAFHANTADYLTSEITESDPVYSSSPASGITNDDISNLGNLSGINTGDQDLSGYVSEEADPVFNSSPSADITEDDINNWNKKSISLNVYGANIDNDASFGDGYGPYAGIIMPETSISTFSMNFTLPADYVSGTTITLRITGSSFSPGNVDLRASFISIARAGVGFIKGNGASSGLEIAGTFNITSSFLPIEVLATIFSPNSAYELEPGDNISFGFYRTVASANDTSTDSFYIHGIEVLY